MTPEETPVVEPDSLEPNDFTLIPPESIRPAKENRHFVRDEDFDALVDNVREFGVLVPLLVRSIDKGTGEYELIAGERRLTAAKEVGLETVPAFVLDYEEDTDRLAVMYAENAMRRDLSTMEKARHVGHLLDLGLTQRDVAEKLGISQPQVSKLATLLKLPEHAHKWVDDGEMSQEEAVRLASLPAPEVKKLLPAGAKQPPAPWRVSEAYDSVIKQGALVKGRELAKEKGFKVINPKLGYVSDFTSDNSPVKFPRSQSDTYATLAHVDKKAHETEKCHAVVVETRGDKPILTPICTNPAAHPRPKGWKPKGAEKATKARSQATTPYAEARKRRQEAVALHLPAFVQLVKDGLAVALKHESDEYCLEFAAYASLELVFDIDDVAVLLDFQVGKGEPADPILKSLWSTTPGTVDGFTVLYASSLAAALNTLEDEIGHLAEYEKRQGWNAGTIESTKRILAHLDGLLEDVPTYDDLVKAVKEGKPLNASEVAQTDDETDEDAPTVTISKYRTVFRRTCSEHGALGNTTTEAYAEELGRKHIADEHDGVGQVVGLS